MIETRFKNSEVGLIPEDWEVKPIGSVADILNGSTPPTANPENYGTTHLFVSPADLGDSKYIENTIKKLSTIGFSVSRKIPKGSILYTCTGSTIGKCGIAFCDLTSNQQINAVLPNGSYNNEYLYYAIQTRESDIRSNASVQAVPLINKTTFSKTLVAFPQKTEQSRIAEALSDVDDLIATTKKLIEKKRNIKEGAMQDLLSGKRRIKKFETDIKLKQTPVGFIPYNWEIDKIGEQFELLPNNTLPREEMSDNGVVQNIHYGDVLIKFGSIVDVQKDDVPYISSPIFKPNYLIKDGDVIIADTAEDETVGKATEITNVGDNKIVSGLHTMWLHPINKGRYGLGFLGYAFNARIYHNQLLPLMQGTKVTSISKNAIQDTFLVVPPKPEQEAIVSTLSAMDSEIQSLEVRLTKYQSLKQGMMQQLLTGKIRLI